MNNLWKRVLTPTFYGYEMEVVSLINKWLVGSCEQNVFKLYLAEPEEGYQRC